MMGFIASPMREWKGRFSVADTGEFTREVGELMGDEVHHVALTLNLAPDSDIEEESSTRRNFSNTLTQTTTLAAPVSSSMVRNITPLAEPGRWRTRTKPSASSQRPSRACIASVRVTMRRRVRSVGRNESG